MTTCVSMPNSEPVEQQLQALYNEIHMLRGALQVLGELIMVINPKANMVIAGGHIVYYDPDAQRYVVDQTVRMTYDEVYEFLGLTPDSPTVHELRALGPPPPSPIRLLP